MDYQRVSPAFRVVIVGGGTAGWMCAAALSQQLDPARYAVTLIESDEIPTVGVGEATLPHLKTFHDALGIDEAAFMRATDATIKLGIEFRDWNRPGDSYIHPFGTFGESWGGVGFHHHWRRAVALGLSPAPFQDYSFAVAACRRQVFDLPNEDPNSIRSTYSYAYHLDAGLYAGFLRQRAVQNGVRRIEGRIIDIAVNAQTGCIDWLTLGSGPRVSGDLYVDCSGFRALLAGGVMHAKWQDWSHWLPCDRALAVQSPRTADFAPYTRSTAQEGGWTWRIPLQSRTGNGYVYASSFIGDDQAHATLMGALDGPAIIEPRALRFSAGRRPEPWTRNCVAIGLASGFLEPLESTSIYLIQKAVMDLVELMPVSEMDARLIAEFNRRSDVEYERIRDFLILHYAANSREGALWDHVRHMALPDSLSAKMALFRARGHLPFYKDGLFSRDSWLSVLMGQGIEAQAWGRLADGLSASGLDNKLKALQDRIGSNADLLTPHDRFIDGYCREEVSA